MDAVGGKLLVAVLGVAGEGAEPRREPAAQAPCSGAL
jgi:hypothetical protein